METMIRSLAANPVRQLRIAMFLGWLLVILLLVRIMIGGLDDPGWWLAIHRPTAFYLCLGSSLVSGLVALIVLQRHGRHSLEVGSAWGALMVVIGSWLLLGNGDNSAIVIVALTVLLSLGAIYARRAVPSSAELRSRAAERD